MVPPLGLVLKDTYDVNMVSPTNIRQAVVKTAGGPKKDDVTLASHTIQRQRNGSHPLREREGKTETERQKKEGERKRDTERGRRKGRQPDRQTGRE